MLALILLTFFTVAKVLDYIYVFQTKEYRFDRFRAHLNDFGKIGVLYNRTVRMPAKSIRNILLVLTSLFTGAALLIATAPLWSLIYFVLAILLVPITTLFLVSFAIYLTEPLAQFKRNRLIDLAKIKVSQSSALFIGVSGTYGKTTTKEFMYQILSHKFKTAKTDKNMNSEVGVAMSILKNLKTDTEIFVAEVGAYKRMEVYRACTIFNPTYAVITAFGNQHLDLFGSHENLVRSESEILELIPQNGTAYINKDVPEFNRITTGARYNVVSYSLHKAGATIFVTNHKHSAGAQSATVHYKNKSLHIKTGLAGIHTLQNLLPCIAFAMDMGLTPDTIKKAIASLDPIIGKLSVHTGPNGSSTLHDASNSSLEGFISAIKTAAEFGHAHKYIVSKGIIELGIEKQESYKQVLNALANTGIVLVTTDPVFAQNNIYPEQIITLKNESKISTYLLSKLDSTSLVVLEGKFTNQFISTFITQ